MYFPKWFGGNDFNYLDNMIKLIETRIELELEGENEVLLQVLNELSNYFLDFAKPRNFGRENNFLVDHELGFEEIRSSMEESGIMVKELTIFEFYSRIKHFEKRNAELKNGNK